MLTIKKVDEIQRRKRPPAKTPEARENQLIALAYDRAEKQILDGTASSQVITHFLKLGSTKEKIEQDILREQAKLVKAKTEAMRSAQRVEELYKDAIIAMRKYQGTTEVPEDDQDV